ncbi:MAG: hypothetical protein Q4A71_02425 [Actinomycetaceae bacterium]|nr:hypothetical protein [Actinomycetaceae bacterium]
MEAIIVLVHMSKALSRGRNGRIRRGISEDEAAGTRTFGFRLPYALPTGT